VAPPLKGSVRYKESCVKLIPIETLTIYFLLNALGHSCWANDRFSCLPANMKSIIVSAEKRSDSSGHSTIKEVTVEERLIEMGVRCKRGKLLNKEKREIRFYKLTGCWGYPVKGAQEILQKQDEEIRELKKKYSVIEITCWPSGGPRP